MYITDADIRPLPKPKNVVFFPIVEEFLPKMQDMISQDLENSSWCSLKIDSICVLYISISGRRIYLVSIFCCTIA
jgi:hypothetical protein